MNPRGEGVFDVHVLYYDERDGSARFRLHSGDRTRARDGSVLGLSTEWIADRGLPTGEPNGHSAVRKTFERVRLAAGEPIVLEGTPDGDEHAVVDYIEVTPSR
jgi:hypothetical protein